MKRNLRAWTLSTHSEVHFPFDILPQSSEISTGERGKRIVTVTRPGFDFWHHRAVLMYSFDYGLGSQSGDVLLEKINGKWQVHSYTGFLL